MNDPAPFEKRLVPALGFSGLQAKAGQPQRASGRQPEETTLFFNEFVLIKCVSRQSYSKALKPFIETETDDLYQELVAELAYTAVPTGLMGIVILLVGSYAALVLAIPLLLVVAAIGFMAAMVKVGAMRLHTRRLTVGPMSLTQVRRWERRHAWLTMLMGLSVGIISTVIFTQPELSVQIVATAMVFGYSAGVASRVSVRPKIALAAIALAALPAIAGSALQGNTPHLITSLIMASFFIAGTQSVLHVYNTTARQICMRQQMARYAHCDALTGLANRRALYDAFDRRAGKHSGPAAVHCFDLDGFKSVNDRFGHLEGDALLIEISGRLKALVRAPDLVARVGGDEFILLQALCAGPEAAERMARDVVDLLTRPYALAGGELSIGISLGYALSLQDDDTLQTLISRADKASYRAKARGGGVEPARTADNGEEDEAGNAPIGTRPSMGTGAAGTAVRQAGS